MCWRRVEGVVFFCTRAHTLTKKKKKKKIHRLTELLSLARRGVTHGIRAGSTRDLGSATAFVDMSWFYIMLLIELIVCARVTTVRERRRGRRWGANGGGETPPAAPSPEGSDPREASRFSARNR
jgi:hypothetical protein